MPTLKIVADSSCDLFTVSDVPFEAVPLKVITAEKEYVDNADLDVEAMVDELAHYKGRSSSSCPNAAEWLEAFGDAEEVYCLAITGTLSGSYNAACFAKQTYEETFPDRRVYVMNSLSAGPELQLLIEKLRELLLQGTPFAAVCDAMDRYLEQTGLLFMLESMQNFANNGRVSPLVAKTAGFLGIRVVGQASEKGDLQPLDKCRGEARALDAIVSRLAKCGYAGGRLCIHHCRNEAAAATLRDGIRVQFPEAAVDIRPCRGLCSFYAEQGGLLVGYERG